MGIQCKCTNFNKALKILDLKQEINKAKNFKPPLKHFVIITTGKKDSATEEEIRVLSDEHQKQGLFSIELLAWDDIREFLGDYPDIVTKYYPDFALDNNKNKSSNDWNLSPYLFTREPFIHPKIIFNLLNAAQNIDGYILSVNLSENSYYSSCCPLKIIDFSLDDKQWIACIDMEEKATLYYCHLGVSPSNIHVLYCKQEGGDPRHFQQVAFLTIEHDHGILQYATDQGFSLMEGALKIKERYQSKIHGFLPLCKNYSGRIDYADNQLLIGQDKNSDNLLLKYRAITIALK